MKIFRVLAVLTFVLSVALSVSVVAAPAAEAYPQRCSLHREPGTQFRTGFSYCSYGSGSHRVRLHCNAGYTVYGRWVGTGSRSYASCATGHRIADYFYELQGD